MIREPAQLTHTRNIVVPAGATGRYLGFREHPFAIWMVHMVSIARRPLVLIVAAVLVAFPLHTPRTQDRPPSYVVFFEPGSASLSGDSKPSVLEAAEMAKRRSEQNRFSHVKIVAYADDGDDSQRLADQRATAVALELTAHGIAADRIRTEGRDKDHPGEDEDVMASPRNRRTRIVIYGPGE